MSSHVFVGEVRNAYFISTTGKKISARQAAQEFAQWKANRAPTSLLVESQLYVIEPLLWRAGKPQRTVLLREVVPSAGYTRAERRVRRFTEILAAHRQEVGKKFIFLTEAISQRGRRTYFISSYGWSQREEVKRKSEVQRAVKQLKGRRSQPGGFYYPSAFDGGPRGPQVLAHPAST